jgi:hypothetical protein
VIEMRRRQLSFGDGLIAGEVSDLREGWMHHADRASRRRSSCFTPCRRLRSARASSVGGTSTRLSRRPHLLSSTLLPVSSDRVFPTSSC